MVLELPVSNRYHRGDEALSERGYLTGALHGPIGWTLARLAAIQPGQAATLFPSCKDVLLTGAPAAPERA